MVWSNRHPVRQKHEQWTKIMIHSLKLSPNGSNECNDQQIKMDMIGICKADKYDTQILLERLQSALKWHPKHQGNHPLLQVRLSLGAPNGLCKSLLQVTWNSCPKRWWCFKQGPLRERSQNPTRFHCPKLNLKMLLVCHMFRPNFPWFFQKLLLPYNKFPTAHPLRYADIFDLGPSYPYPYRCNKGT